MKAVLIFVLGLAIGAGVMFALKPDHSAEVADSHQREQIVRDQTVALLGQLEKARIDLGRAEQELGSARGALTETTAVASEATAAAKLNVPPDDGTKKKKFADMIREVGKSQVTSQLDGKLATLKERLHLTPAQEGRLKELIGVESQQTVQALERFLDGEGQPGDFGKLARLQRGDLPTSVEGMLTAEQQPVYAAFQAEEKANRIEMKANSELLGLQAAGGLSPEQKDQAFNQLSQLASSEEEVDFDSLKDADAVRGFMDEAIGKRVKAMQSVLNESQMEIYQRQVEMQRQMMSQFLPPPKE